MKYSSAHLTKQCLGKDQIGWQVFRRNDRDLWPVFSWQDVLCRNLWIPCRENATWSV